MCVARKSLISRCLGLAEQRRSSDCDTSRVLHRSEPEHTRSLPAFASGPFVSSDRKFGNAANSRNFSTHEVAVEIAEVFLKFGLGFTLRQIVGELLEVAEPYLSVLPVDVSSDAHVTSVLLWIGIASALGLIASRSTPARQPSWQLDKLLHEPYSSSAERVSHSATRASSVFRRSATRSVRRMVSSMLLKSASAASCWATSDSSSATCCSTSFIRS